MSRFATDSEQVSGREVDEEDHGEGGGESKEGEGDSLDDDKDKDDREGEDSDDDVEQPPDIVPITLAFVNNILQGKQQVEGV